MPEMPEPTTSLPLQDRLHRAYRYRWPVVPLLLVCLAVAAAGLAIPVGTSIGNDRATRSILPATSPEAPSAEDLTGLLAIERWGAPVAEEEAEVVEEPEDPAALNPALQGIGFIGVTFTEDEYAVWLNLSAVTDQGRQDAQPELEAGTVRLLAGDYLPDGRRLVAVTLDSITLANVDGQREHHLLFGDSDGSPN